MCMGSKPSTPPTPAPPPAPPPSVAPLDLKLNKNDKTQAEINRKNRKGKRKFRIDKEGKTQKTMSTGGLGFGSQGSSLGILKK